MASTEPLTLVEQTEAGEGRSPMKNSADGKAEGDKGQSDDKGEGDKQ